MSTDYTLLDTFERLAREKLGQVPSLEYSLTRKERNLELIVPKKSEHGFDVGATVEIYGVYPWADEWHGGAWEPMGNWPEEALCSMYFGLLRTLLCSDARLRLVYRRRKLSRACIDIKDANGEWSIHDEVGLFVLPFGEMEIVELQNEHLTPRCPYKGLRPIESQPGAYYW